MRFEGIYTRAVKPFAVDGSVAREGSVRPVDHLVGPGVHGIVIGGTTGEYYARTGTGRSEQMTAARAASMVTPDVKRALRAARSIRAGTVRVERCGEGDITAPSGGCRQPGFGGRDNSLHAHDPYTGMETIRVDPTERGVEESLD